MASPCGSETWTHSPSLTLVGARLGKTEGSDERIVATRDRTWRTRAMWRRPDSERSQAGEILNFAGVPWDLRAKPGAAAAAAREGEAAEPGLAAPTKDKDIHYGENSSAPCPDSKFHKSTTSGYVSMRGQGRLVVSRSSARETPPALLPAEEVLRPSFPLAT